MDRAIVAGCLAAGAAASMAWAMRGRSSSVFARSVWRGPRDSRAVALTFDDGPTPQTVELLELLDRFGIRATFFQCGRQVLRNANVAATMAAAGHEIGNHTDTHARLWLQDRSFLRHEIEGAQGIIREATGVTPALFRAPYGVRWFGLRRILRDAQLLDVMWTIIGRDWSLSGDRVATRILGRICNGAIVCLHDGRALAVAPDITNTISALQIAVPRLLDQGYVFRTVTDLIGYSSAVCPTTSSTASSK